MNPRPRYFKVPAKPLPSSADWLRRLTRFWFGLFAITSLVSGATVVPNAWVAQDLKLRHVSRVSRC